MRNHIIIITIVIQTALLFSSCEPSAEPDQRSLLFEVVNDGSTTNYPPGRTLVLRAFKNGTVEWDSYPSIHSGEELFPFRHQSRSAKIDDRRIREFDNLLKKIDAEDITFFGPSISQSVDSFVTVSLNYTLNGAMKSITLKENDTHIHLESIGSRDLREFLRLLYETRAALEKEARGR